LRSEGNKPRAKIPCLQVVDKELGARPGKGMGEREIKGGDFILETERGDVMKKKEKKKRQNDKLKHVP